MAQDELVPFPVPVMGPLELGAVYSRAELHERFGGNGTAGIVQSKSESAVLLFHTEEPNHQFYGDGWSQDGFYGYSGEGRHGDMTWTFNNRALRDHAAVGRDLLLFERAQRKGGLWRFVDFMWCHGWDVVTIPDSSGTLRSAFIFKLRRLTGGDLRANVSSNLSGTSVGIDTLRGRAYEVLPPVQGPTASRAAVVYARSVEVRRYVLARAAGVCEACGNPAPFLCSDGSPYLETHHIDRLADGGMDRPDRVAGICANCHRRCHQSADGQTYNETLRARVQLLEQSRGPIP